MNSIHATVQYAKPVKPKDYNLDTNLLLHFDKDPLTDDSIFKNPINITGDLLLDSSTKKFGNSSIRLTGSNNIYIPKLTFPYLWGYAYTIEFWMMPTINQSASGYLFGFNASSSLQMYISTSYLSFVNGSSYSINISSPFSNGVMLNQWNHIALSFRSKNIYLFVNGVLKNSKTGVSSYNLYHDNYYFCIGNTNRGLTSGGFIGYIDEFRFSGDCLYTTDFTPPTEPFSPYLEG